MASASAVANGLTTGNVSIVAKPGLHKQSNNFAPPTSSRELFPTHGTGAIDCTGQNVSTGHGAHAPLLMSPLKEPAAQGVHVSAKIASVVTNACNSLKLKVVIEVTGRTINMYRPLRVQL